MPFVDVAIPGLIGLVLLLWPQSAFLGARVTPDAKKLRLVRTVGAVLLVVAIVYLVIGLVGT
jgi:uncharacterized iron-regulated membrane protein